MLQRQLSMQFSFLDMYNFFYPLEVHTPYMKQEQQEEETTTTTTT